MTLEEKIKKSSNMVEISQVILGDVWSMFINKFVEEYGPVNRKEETQQDWINAVSSTYRKEIAAERKRLFDLIPIRFRSVRMYKELETKIKKHN